MAEGFGTDDVEHLQERRRFLNFFMARSMPCRIRTACGMPVLAAMISRMVAGPNEGVSFMDEPQRKEADNGLRVAHNISLDVLRVQSERFSHLLAGFR